MLSTYLYKQRSVDLYPLEATEESSTHKKKKKINMATVLPSELLCIP